jgi:hypothetical protein
MVEKGIESKNEGTTCIQFKVHKNKRMKLGGIPTMELGMYILELFPPSY